MSQRIRETLAGEVSEDFPQELLDCIEKYWSECERSGLTGNTIRQGVRPHLAMFFRWVVGDYTPKSGRNGRNDIEDLRKLL